MNDTPESIVRQLTIWWQDILQALGMIACGIVVSIGRDMQQRPEPPPIRVVFWRAVSTGLLSLGAGSILVIVPNLPLLGLLGLSAAIASLGSDFLERLVMRVMPPNRDGGNP